MTSHSTRTLSDGAARRPSSRRLALFVKGASMELPASLHEHLRELEERLLRPDARRSRQALDELLADDFVEFASDGVAYDKAQVIDALEREVPCRRSLADFQIVPLVENVILHTDRLTRQNVASNEVVDS